METVRDWPDHSEMTQTSSQQLRSHSGHLCSDFKILAIRKKNMTQSILQKFLEENNGFKVE